jgi:CheY-like chemotaxis protein
MMPLTALIVDDVAANRVVLQMFLQRQGFEADVACGGEEAIELAAKRSYDAILMDLEMPIVDGYTATTRIRQAEPSNRRAVIVAVTAATDQKSREKCFACGMDDHYEKPLDLSRFMERLTDLIARRSLATANPGVSPPRPVRH